jgi:uncharacterized RDD family membrane protein YckC
MILLALHFWVPHTALPEDQFAITEIKIAVFLVGTVDSIFLVAIPQVLFFGPTGVFNGMNADDWASLPGNLLWYSVPLTVNWLYRAIMESSNKQATIGKLLLKVRVADLAGNRISFWRATVRHFSKMISSSILLTGFLMAGWTKKKQALHDKVSGCLVIRSV